MATVPANVEGQSDAELIAAVREGEIASYGALYERHVAAAYNLAHQLTRSPTAADDLVSEAFAKVLNTSTTSGVSTEAVSEELAPILGLTPTGVSSLAYRAREGLRQAYLQVHIADYTDQRCRATAERLGAWTRDGLAKHEKAKVDEHLDVCKPCRALAAELADINGAMRGMIAPLVLGVDVVGYLDAIGVKVAATTVAATTGAIAAVAFTGPRQFTWGGPPAATR